MSLFFIAIFLFLAPLIVGYSLYIVALSDVKSENIFKSGENAIPNPEFKPAIPAIAGLLLMLAYVGLESCVIVPAGHIGIQVTFGTVNQETMGEGLHFVNPLSSIQNLDVRLVSAKLVGSAAGTKDLQQVHTDIVVNYRISGDKAAHIYKEFGLDLQDKVVMPFVNESFKAITAHYTSEELITKRDEVSAGIKQELSDKLGKYNIIVSDISLVNFGFSAEYQKAIEAKVIATQSKLQAEQDLARIEVEAKQTIAKAEGRAKAIQIETAAINAQGGASYVQLKAIEKWNGALPSTIAGGATPFVNLK
jgi:regulator of protease activity HflC (stomatin/prohibitin superfamily)